MNYDLTQSVERGDPLDYSPTAPFGVMPPSMLMSKFEETDIGDTDDYYEDYARNTLTDWGPDKNKFEHEQPRGGVNKRSGRLQLQYYGHRGDADTPYRPEWFDGFAGPEDQDPRGINVDPDMKQMRRQEEARMRFVRWSADGSDFVVDGGRAERKVIADQQSVFKIVRDRLKVFDRQLDGRREGMRRTYAHKSHVQKSVLVQSYGDYVKDAALTPQRKANIICAQILRNSRAWRVDTADADFAFAKYSQICRRARARPSDHNRVKDVDGDGRAGPEDQSRHYKTCGLVMASIVRGKRQALANAAAGNMDLADARIDIARKTAPFVRDLTHILRAMAADAEFSHADEGLSGKTPHQQTAVLMRQVVQNHITPAHHFLNAELIYKAADHGDMRKVKDLVVGDAKSQDVRDILLAGRAAKRRLITGAKLARADDADYAESTRTHNYRHERMTNGDRRIRLAAYDQAGGVSDPTQNRRVNHQGYRAPAPGDTAADMRHGDNAYGERHGGALGSKYMTRFIERDGKVGDLRVD